MMAKAPKLQVSSRMSSSWPAAVLIQILGQNRVAGRSRRLDGTRRRKSKRAESPKGIQGEANSGKKSKEKAEQKTGQ